MTDPKPLERLLNAESEIRSFLRNVEWDTDSTERDAYDHAQELAESVEAVLAQLQHSRQQTTEAERERDIARGESKLAKAFMGQAERDENLADNLLAAAEARAEQAERDKDSTLRQCIVLAEAVEAAEARVHALEQERQAAFEAGGLAALHHLADALKKVMTPESMKGLRELAEAALSPSQPRTTEEITP